MRYLTIFPAAENIHLIKDVGMVPYALHRYEGYDATLACYRNGDYPYMAAETKGLKLAFIKPVFRNTFLDGVLFIIRNRKQYDALQVFHLQWRSLLWLWLFKMIHPGGKTYLKLDARATILQDTPVKKGTLRAWLLQRTDLVSAETRDMQQLLQQAWQRTVVYVPNGFFNIKERPVDYTGKENIIITVGRIGAPEKATDVLLEAFAIIAPQRPGWTLKLVGPVEENFHDYINTFFSRYPALQQRIIFTGAVYDRRELFGHYATAKIFCLTSKWESFGIALLEAADAGCYLVSSAIPAAADITAQETYGSTFPVDDVPALAAILASATADEEMLAENCSRVQDFAAGSFSWQKIAGDIDHLLKNNA